ncbi:MULTISPECIES: MATE family efflux transporter [Alphaproteobacteria]|uniref:MATE family efflux transporter n=2 Tax=Alphaproteobacteria TaxID=28211 RepID=A0A512HDK6_9HYPH|nr:MULTISPECIES: MATE family efflux transporter [Alphaproteobacteria]GEO83537.1 MATE family efflux transporter [Ciceribacter naphthalenivorans]GLR24312.1 MATE family efflux transporter [Ciceribacter naphthalenivorans]GLT07168.1 MATE family efflux transporter [Sphingomonas psychrolutea]
MDTRSETTVRDGRRTGVGFAVTHRLVLSIAIPMTIGFVTTPLLGLTDTAVVGRTGSAEALAGLAIGAVLFDLLFGSLNFLRASTTALVAQAFGRGDQCEQQAVFWRSFLLAIAFGLVIVLASPLLLSAGLALLGPEGRVAEATVTYFSIRILAGPFSLINFTLLGFVLGRGRGTTGLFLQALLNGTNIALSVYLGLMLGWGIAGVAWGTVIGEGVAVVVGLAIVVLGFDREKAPRIAAIFARSRLIALIAINRDLLIRTFVLLGAFTLLTRIGNGFGPVALAANAVLMNFFMVASFYLDGMANAAEQIAGRAIGAGDRQAFDRAVKLTALWSFGLALVTAVLFLVFGHAAIAVLTTAKEVRTLAGEYLPWAALTAVTGALAFQMDGIFIGATWSREMRNMMLAAFGGYLVALAALVPPLGNHGLWLALNLFLALRGLLLVSLLRGKRDQTFAASQ